MDDQHDKGNGETDMKLIRPWMIAGLILTAPGAAATDVRGQLLPTAGQVVPGLLDRVKGAIDTIDLDRLSPAHVADRLAAARLSRVTNLLRQHRDQIELDDRRQPARRGVILLTGADAVAIDALRGAGYDVEQDMVDGLDLSLARLTPPKNRSLSRALREVRKLAPHAQASADNLYFPSGTTMAMANDSLASGRIEGRPAGMIDGGVARHPSLIGGMKQRGFARGAPRASAHGTAVASLISGKGLVTGAAPGTSLLVADVYGDDPAGGSAFAIVRALGWMAAQGVRVVTISLVGPANPLLEGAIRLARDRGVTLVAAVGNDGPAAPPAYPASYPAVLAVTGIDGRGRILAEAGRALHVDFAAPGANMQAATMGGGKGPVRGTSFAAPLVAGRLAAQGSIDALHAEATLAKPPVICRSCRNN